jgi:hypothetical protein
MMKRTLLLTTAALMACWTLQGMAQSAAQTPLRISVLGDSYSTYEGFMETDSNLVWYFPKGSTLPYHDSRNGNDVTTVEQTWWHRLCTEHGYRLESNNSFSGSTICYTGYKNRQTGQPGDYTNRSFVSRMWRLGSPDVILICGATNDSWAGSPIGEYQWQDWTEQDLRSFRPAMACLLQRTLWRYPGAKVVFILNSELRQSINESVYTICQHYGVPVVTLHDIEKQGGHPSVAGMKAMADQVYEALKQL